MIIQNSVQYNYCIVTNNNTLKPPNHETIHLVLHKEVVLSLEVQNELLRYGVLHFWTIKPLSFIRSVH